MSRSTASEVVLSRQEMYFFDNYTIETIGIPGAVLMESAGKGCSNFIQDKLLKPESCIAVFCGSGNNGGDGFVIARYLLQFGHKVNIFLLGNVDKMSPETFLNYEKSVELFIPISIITSDDEWKSIVLKKYDLVVDAIFGIGFKGELQGWRSEVVEAINLLDSIRISIDIASGIDADTGFVSTAVMADYTLTMATCKYGHYLGEGRRFSGRLEIIDIGIPKELFQKFPPQATVVNQKSVNYPERSCLSHKGNYGRIGIIGGSPGFSGAALMAAKAALRAGGGLITIFHPIGMESIFDSAILEVMSYALPETNEGEIDFKTSWEKLKTMDVLLVGPGLGTSQKVTNFLREILLKWNKSAVLDADALNIISNNRELMDLLRNKKFILTPHIGEFARLKQTDIEQIIKDPISELTDFCKKYKCNVLLKSATSIYTEGDKLFFNITGNNGLATGGSGDVLSGIIVSFLGQGVSLQDAAIAGSYLLGKTAEDLAGIRQSRSIIPTDIIANLFKY